MSAARKKPTAAPTLRVATTSSTNDTSSDARRAEIRRALAEWLTQTSAMLMRISDTAADLHDEVTTIPDGEIARELTGDIDLLKAISYDVSQAQSNLSCVYLEPDFELVDPLAMVRKGGAA